MDLEIGETYIDLGKSGKEVVYAGREHVLSGSSWVYRYIFYPANALVPLLSTYGLSKKQVKARIK